MMTVVPTIDVEAAHGRRPFEQFIKGELGGADGDWGVLRQARIFQRHGVSATFFVDCYEHTFWGERGFEEICCRLLEMGQDVQLHTHPAWRDDIHDFAWLRSLKKTKSFCPQHQDFMAKLSYEQQVDVLQHGIELLETWTGGRPVAHRSGGYSIDENTVRALRKVGIPMDSSMNAAHTNSRVSWSTNRVVDQDGLLELPVTLFRQTFELPFVAGQRGTVYGKLLKTDLDCCRLDDFLCYVDRGLAAGLKVMTLFMHSYSLLKFDPFYRSIRPAPRQAQKLDELLGSLVQRPDVEFMNCKTMLEAHRAAPAAFDGPDGVPEVPANLKIVKLALRKFRNTALDATAVAFDRFRYRHAS